MCRYRPDLLSSSFCLLCVSVALWGPSPFVSGIDEGYLKTVEQQIVKAIEQADAKALPVTARLGSARAPELLHDAREPYIKHDELGALHFRETKGQKPAGIVVQWNCHPET